MEFTGILGPPGSDAGTELSLDAALFVTDLRLDQVIAAVIAGKEEYELAPFFCRPLRQVESVTYRQDVMRDLETGHLLDDATAFAASMQAARAHLAQAESSRYDLQKDRWFLDAAVLYGNAVNRLLRDLAAAPLRSRGLADFKAWLAGYVASDRFASFVARANSLQAEMAGVRYGVLIRGRRLDVRRHAGEPDYSSEIKTAFERFRQTDSQQYNFTVSEEVDLNHVEARILTGVAELFSDIFSRVRSFKEEEAGFVAESIVRFDREIQFYVSYLEYIAPLKKLGLSFCYPGVSDTSKEVSSRQSFDLALAGKLAAEGSAPVCNDFYLRNPERILVVSGPNQGGKTTFARTFAQLHYLASLGCPVPGSAAQLFLPDRIFTHFEKEEYLEDLRGKLEDDIVRIHRILESATPKSVIVVNEIFSSTALRDAAALSERIATAVARLDALCVWVTFIDEIGTLNEKTVSVVSTVEPDEPTHRTFKLVRRPADGLAYAMSIAERHGLTYDRLKERLRS